MLPHSRKRLPARWPFWLLIVAWVCANSPQSATYAVLTWLAEARHFSHQHRLTTEVAFLLVGEKPTSTTAAFAAAPQTPAKSFPPAIPADAVLKKIDLAVPPTSELPFPVARSFAHDRITILPPDALTAPPPHEPPRAVSSAV
jgi:hypothetical protein